MSCPLSPTRPCSKTPSPPDKASNLGSRLSIITIRSFLRAAVLCTAAIVLATVSISGCSSSGNTDVIVPSEPSHAGPTTTPGTPTPTGDTQTPKPAADPTATPTEAPGDSGLNWTEVDLDKAIGSEDTLNFSLESVGDGRVLAIVRRFDISSTVLVTDNGTDWTEISKPAYFSPVNIDITGDRWVIQGWDANVPNATTQILISDDQGATWTELLVDLSSIDGTSWIADTIVAEEQIVIVALNDGATPSIDEDADQDLYYETDPSSIHIFLSDGGPAEWVAEFPVWLASGYGASDGFHLIAHGNEGEDYLLYSPDGREWSQTTIDVEVTDSARDGIWTADQTGGEFRNERFEGVYGPDQVLTLPDGIGWVVDLAVGPAGVAAVGGPEAPYEYSVDEPEDGIPLPDIVIEKDGYELRYNQPEGGITLWDLNKGTAVYVFDAEAVQSEAPPEGVREIEGTRGFTTVEDSFMVVFDDPDTGAELVAFTREEISAAFMEEDLAIQNAYDPYDFLVGWSQDGTDWAWQTLQEAFGLPMRSEGDDSITGVELAVGQNFVIAKVQTYELPPPLFEEDPEIAFGVGQSASDSAPLIAMDELFHPPRWFIARVD